MWTAALLIDRNQRGHIKRRAMKFERKPVVFNSQDGVLCPMIHLETLVGLVMRISKTYTARVEVHVWSSADSAHKLHVRVTATIGLRRVTTQIFCKLILRNVGQDDVIERFRRAVIRQ